MSLIALTHTETGEEKQFADFDSIAAFLKAEAEAAVKWTGWEFARLRAELAEVVAMIEGTASGVPAAEPAVSPAPDGILVEGAGVVTDSQLQDAGFVRDAQAPAEPAPESLLERIEHAVEDIIHGDTPAQAS